ncbi:MAG: DNA polymerase IV [Christensenellaceae bacterium]|jgi:DNA polymerase-4|nr:DNA polymerase IV [Christensenellaceae bacterium]
MGERTILHADLNNFYASVESLEHPEYRQVPLAVCGEESLRHGIVLAKNDAAKALGIYTGQVVWQARQICPHLLVVPPHMEKYREYATMARAIYARYTDRVEPFGLDEAWLDVSGSASLFGSGRRIADRLRADMLRETGLSISVGVANNKVFAKLGSDMKKPNATTVLLPSEYRQTIWPLPAGEMLYVGRSARRKLQDIGLYTIGDLARAPLGTLSALLGKWGETLHAYANGLDDSPVAFFDHRDAIKSIGNSTTLAQNLQNAEEIKLVFQVLADSVSSRLRKAGLKAATLHIGVRNADLTWAGKQTKLAAPSCLFRELWESALALYLSAFDQGNPVRALGLRCSDLRPFSEGMQMDIFSRQLRRARDENLELAVDSLRERFGFFSVRHASLLETAKVEQSSFQYF